MVRLRHIPRVVPNPGSIQAVGEHFDAIAETARRRALASLRAQRASPARVEAEIAKLDRWLADWRPRAFHIRALTAKD